MLIDFPDYSKNNPWQVKTIQTLAPMEVRIVNKLELVDCYAMHISWEDNLLKNYGTPEKANKFIERFEDYLRRQSLRSKIIWTLHNLTSHSFALKATEQALRSVILEYASTINLMSMKHAFIIPEKHHSKINLLPHYIEPSRFPVIKKNINPTYFRYGANRGSLDKEFYLKLLNNRKVSKFVSDSRLNIEVDSTDHVITRRRFTSLEADLYAQLANFSTFYRTPKFNSGVINFLIGNKISVFHDKDSVRYMDLPESFNKLCIDLSSLKDYSIADLKSRITIDKSDLNDFIRQRSPNLVSKAFWKGVLL